MSMQVIMLLQPLAQRIALVPVRGGKLHRLQLPAQLALLGRCLAKHLLRFRSLLAVAAAALFRLSGAQLAVRDG
ncbi:hypothetical protein, partial [Paenibacillus lignilyticus]